MCLGNVVGYNCQKGVECKRLHMFDLARYTDYKVKERYTQSFLSSGDIQGIMKKYNNHKRDSNQEHFLCISQQSLSTLQAA